MGQSAHEVRRLVDTACAVVPSNLRVGAEWPRAIDSKLPVGVNVPVSTVIASTMDTVGEASFRRLSQGRASSIQGVPASPRASTQGRRPILICANNVEVAFPICLAYLKPSVSASERAIENHIWPLFADDPGVSHIDVSLRCPRMRLSSSACSGPRIICCRTHRSGATSGPSHCAPWERGRAIATCPRGHPVRAHRSNMCGR
jgi:hypothetical protein